MKKETILIEKIKAQGSCPCEDVVALEVGYRVFVNGQEAFGLSCTPENLQELVLGHLYTEGIIKSLKQAENMEIQEEERKIYVRLEAATGKDSSAERNHALSSLKNETRIPDPAVLFLTADEIFEQPGELFRETGCAHSCAFWKNGKVQCSFEDIGRHNALDKVMGRMLLESLSPENGVIFTSGRISADYLHKIIRSGIRTVVSRAAVTAEAVSLARESGIRLYGFVRKGGGNRYS